MGALRLRFLHKAASVGSFTTLTAPTLSGDPVVGQTIYATNGTYSLTPDSITPYWALDGEVNDDFTGDSYFISDIAEGGVISYGEIAHRAGRTDTALNLATSTAAVTQIDLTDAVVLTRASASGDPLEITLDFGANVYGDGSYFLRLEESPDTVFLEADLVQDVIHRLNDDDLQTGAPIPATIAAAALAVGLTNYVRVTVFTTSPNGLGFLCVSDMISPTDGLAAMTWSASDNNLSPGLSGGNLIASQGSGLGSVRGLREFGFDKVYFEIDPSASMLIGAADASAPLNDEWYLVVYGGSGSTHVGALQGNGFFYTGTTETNTAQTYGGSNIVGVAVDRVAKKIWFSIDGVFAGSPSAGTGGNSISGVGSSMFPAVQMANGQTATLIPGTTPGGTAGFTYTPPTGFVAP